MFMFCLGLGLFANREDINIQRDEATLLKVQKTVRSRLNAQRLNDGHSGYRNEAFWAEYIRIGAIF